MNILQETEKTLSEKRIRRLYFADSDGNFELSNIHRFEPPITTPSDIQLGMHKAEEVLHNIGGRMKHVVLYRDNNSHYVVHVVMEEENTKKRMWSRNSQFKSDIECMQDLAYAFGYELQTIEATSKLSELDKW